MNKFSASSEAKLATCHKDLQLILRLALERSSVDFGIIQGERTIAQQREYFNAGKSKVNPDAYSTESELCEKGKHLVITDHPLYSKSRAVDIKVAEKHNGKWLTFDVTHLAYLAGVITSCAKELYAKGMVDHIVRWGSDWDSDGVIALDHSLDDYPHFELIKPKV